MIVLYRLVNNAFIMFMRYYLGKFNLLCFYILGFEQKLE